MSDKKLPEQARASPSKRQSQPRLNPRFVKSMMNGRFEDGGERFVWDRIDVVDQSEPSVSDDEESEEKPKLSVGNDARQGGQVSVMLVLQAATLVVAVIALVAAL